MNRRRALTLFGTVGLTGLAGCTGEDGQFEYTAAPASIPAGERSGYETDGLEKIEINETVEAGGVSRDVDISTWSSAYSSPEDQTSMFLLSTPDVSVAGVSLNPLARLSGAELITRIIDEGLARTGEDLAVRDVEQEDELAVAVLGEERTVPVFSAVVEAGGSDTSDMEGAQNGEIPVRLYLLSFAHEEDVLLAVGFHPEGVEASEDIQSLMASIEHPVEAP